MIIKIPYGDGYMPLDVPERRIKAVLAAGDAGAGEIKPLEINADERKVVCGADERKVVCGGDERKKVFDADERGIVLDALAHPIGSARLCELAKGKKSVTIITSDHTRPMPSRVTIPLLLNEIKSAAPDAAILILVATGLHRATTDDELEERFGEDIVINEKIIVHDCRDENCLRDMGALPSGRALALSRYALDADLLVAEGFIEPHFFAGFSGGRKSVFPGIAGYKSVVSNHCSEFIADKNSRAGVLDGNPVHADMEYAAKKAGLAFILNVMLSDERKIIDAFAGELKTAHMEGCARLMKKAALDHVKAKIVITSNGGYPLDQNLYQLVKCMDTAEKCCEEGGVIIAVGECRDGTGGQAFYEDFAGEKTPEELTKLFMSRKPEETKTDQWQSQVLARILGKHHVIVVSPSIEKEARDMGLGYADDLNGALTAADDLIGRTGNDGSDIVVIPNGLSVVVV